MVANGVVQERLENDQQVVVNVGNVHAIEELLDLSGGVGDCLHGRSIGLIVDIHLEDGLDQILQGDDALDANVVVAVGDLHDLGDQADLDVLARHLLQSLGVSGVAVQADHGASEQLQHRADGHLLVGVDQDQVLHVQDAHDVVASILVDGDTAVALGEDVQAGVLVQHLRVGQHVHLVQRRAGDADGGRIHGQSALHGGDGLLTELVLVLVELEHGVELPTVIDVAELLAEHAVEKHGDGLADDPQERHDGSCVPDGVGTKLQAISGAVGLGNDLTEGRNEDGGNDEAPDAAGEVGGENGDQGVDHDVTDEQGHQQEVALLTNGLDLLGVLLLPDHLLDLGVVQICACDLCHVALGNHLQADHVETHQTEVQAGEHAGHRDENDAEDDLHNEHAHRRSLRQGGDGLAQLVEWASHKESIGALEDAVDVVGRLGGDALEGDRQGIEGVGGRDLGARLEDAAVGGEGETGGLVQAGEGAGLGGHDVHHEGGDVRDDGIDDHEGSLAL